LYSDSLTVAGDKRRSKCIRTLYDKSSTKCFPGAEVSNRQGPGDRKEKRVDTRQYLNVTKLAAFKSKVCVETEDSGISKLTNC
jgi:hypothetical protein